MQYGIDGKLHQIMDGQFKAIITTILSIFFTNVILFALFLFLYS